LERRGCLQPEGLHSILLNCWSQYAKRRGLTLARPSKSTTSADDETFTLSVA
jgi:hypothetical protein